MSEPPGCPGPAWSRRIAGGNVVLFVLLSAALWTASLLAWEVRQGDLVVLFLGLGAFAPLAWLAVRLERRPLWALRIRADRDAVASAVRKALGDRAVTRHGPGDAVPEGPFLRCEILLRIDDPECWVGIQGSVGEAESTVLLLPRSGSRGVADALRRSIAAQLESA